MARFWGRDYVLAYKMIIPVPKAFSRLLYIACVLEKETRFGSLFFYMELGLLKAIVPRTLAYPLTTLNGRAETRSVQLT